MDVGLIPKKQSGKSFWQQVLLYVSFWLVLTVIVSLVVVFQLAKKTQIALDEAEQQLVTPKTAEQGKLEKEVLLAQKRIYVFDILSKEQSKISEILALCERDVHPQVFFDRLSFTRKDQKLWLTGIADNFQALGQQSLIFRKDSMILKSDLTQVGIRKEGGISFAFEIVLNPEIFLNK